MIIMKHVSMLSQNDIDLLLFFDKVRFSDSCKSNFKRTSNNSAFYKNSLNPITDRILSKFVVY